MPQFLQTLLGYTAELAGLVLSAGAVLLLFAIPVVGQLTTRVQVRYIIAVGWLCLAIAMYYSTQRIDLLISFGVATWLRVAQVIGLAFLFVPITLAAYIGMPAEKSNAVAGMINFMRNMGSSVGTSMVTTMIARREQFHQTILVNHTTAGNQTLRNVVNGLTQQVAHAGMNLHDAQRQAYGRIYQTVQVQAATLSYIDAFWVLSVGSAIMFCLSFLLKKNDPRAGGPAAVG
jgi:DHA2 family multidrug resistance protein